MYTLTFKTLEEVNIVMNGLGELPAKVSINLIGEINKQIQPQLPKKETKAVEDAKPE